VQAKTSEERGGIIHPLLIGDDLNLRRGNKHRRARQRGGLGRCREERRDGRLYSGIKNQQQNNSAASALG